MIRSVTTPAATPATTAANPKREQLKAAAQAFEAVFMRQMIGSMRQASLGDDLLGSSATNQFRDMQDSQVADQMAKSGKGFGISKMLLDHFDQAEKTKLAQTEKPK